jgi:hypothetical protein
MSGSARRRRCLVTRRSARFAGAAHAESRGDLGARWRGARPRLRRGGSRARSSARSLRGVGLREALELIGESGSVALFFADARRSRVHSAGQWRRSSRQRLLAPAGFASALLIASPMPVRYSSARRSRSLDSTRFSRSLAAAAIDASTASVTRSNSACLSSCSTRTSASRRMRFAFSSASASTRFFSVVELRAQLGAQLLATLLDTGELPLVVGEALLGVGAELLGRVDLLHDRLLALRERAR